MRDAFRRVPQSQFHEASNGIIRANEKISKEMKTMMRFGLLAVLCGWLSLSANAVPAQSPWEQPAAALAEQIAGILGPGQMRLTFRNLSSIPASELPDIQRLLEQDLKTRGVTPAGDESANAVRITLSEDARQRLWVAEVIEGDQTQVAMVELAPAPPASTPAPSGLLLRKDTILTTRAPILSALEVGNALVVLEPDQIVLSSRAANGWQELKRVSIPTTDPLARDPRGILVASQDGASFEARLPGVRCTGSLLSAGAATDWTTSCSASDDPWAIVTPPAGTTSSTSVASGASVLRAFYNATRNYFTGVVSPSLDVELPPFYSAALLPRAAGKAALLVAGIDGRVQLTENGAVSLVAGTRDWGSDLGMIRSGCGTGTQVIASGSGEAASDSLRAYELPTLEAVPVSAPLAMQGAVTAIWSAPDAKSLYAAVRTAPNQYEVDRVSALCN